MIFIYGMLVGFGLAVALAALVGLTFMVQTDHYSLSHWKLNVKLPLKTMWMNLGYWKSQDGKPVEQFDEACSTLLRQVLDASGVLTQQTHAGGRNTPGKSISILDLGFGCGDQTSELARLVSEGSMEKLSYVGLTLNKSQAQSASRKLARELSGDGDSKSKVRPESFTLLCGNAANPESWDSSVKLAVNGLKVDDPEETWLLALDCLYHFSPSRRPVFEYAANTLDAHVMAFDLLLNESAGWKDKLIATAVGLLLGCPMNAFITEKQYRNQLIEVGYDRDEIVLQDISEDVFPGLVNFITQQRSRLRDHGIACKELTVMRNVFNWFHTSGVLKATIVVARQKMRA